MHLVSATNFGQKSMIHNKYRITFLGKNRKENKRTEKEKINPFVNHSTVAGKGQYMFLTNGSLFPLWKLHHQGPGNH